MRRRDPDTAAKIAAKQRVLGLCCALAALAPAAASAHGEAPRALSLATPSGDGVAAVVRLTEGLALRDGEVFRYLCPALWGDDEVGPAVGLRGGPTVLGTSSGLAVLDSEGRVAPHPDAEGHMGRSVALRAGGGKLWQLRADGDACALLELAPSTITLRFADSPPWMSFAVGDDRVQLVRLDGGGSLEQLLLSFDGEELARASAVAPEGSVAAFARMVGDQPYVALLVQGGLENELGRIEGDSFLSLHRGTGAIAGPVELASGERFVAVGGGLARFDGDQLAALDEPAIVTCLDRAGGAAYACADGGLRELLPGGLGASWFELEQLAPPLRSRVPADLADACDLQWQRFRVDLLGAGVEVPSGDDGEPARGSRDAGVPNPSGPTELDAATGAGAADGGGGCRVQPRRGSGVWRGVGLAVALLVLRRRRGSSARKKAARGGSKWPALWRNWPAA